ncbi:hypothetical protein M231_02425 [Tremella mesenterica]|uniref:Uncharacterized protein n=1 Tax=Tremella mesenterica TaxID=5217 RepID=A0A4Q1BQT7_TREME|nr:hypothetical protein M231_02425 [Tremella mesenterica]
MAVIPVQSVIEHDSVPTWLEGSLVLPPFPPCSAVPFHLWQSQGLWLPLTSASSEGRTASVSTVDPPRDSRGNLLVSIQGGPSGSLSAPKKVVLRRSDCLKLGNEEEEWVEPDGTSLASYYQSTPPFTRVLTALQEFLSSRVEEFLFARNKRLFDLMRNALSLRSDVPGPHWPGSGPNGQPYIPPARVARSDHWGSLKSPHHVEYHAPQEICFLLSRTEASVRGFLAMARKEAEAGWDTGPAIKLAHITASFLGFLVHHEVLPEVQLQESIRRAFTLARSAPRHIANAKVVEDAVAASLGWNRALWVAHGGTYGQAERGGMEREADVHDSAPLADEEDDGGWKVHRVLPGLATLYSPFKHEEVNMLQHLPYSRRRIVDVLPPMEPSAITPPYASGLLRLVTAPAPWTKEEGWRRSRMEDTLEVDPEPQDEGVGPLEREKPTIEEPAEIIIWAEPEKLAGLMREDILGMAIRGRWALFGSQEPTMPLRQWWAVKLQDYVLPNFWQSDAALFKTS